MAELTPMMKQYLEIKKDNPDSILFFRLGDFYEMFADDAKLASRELDLTLTSRDHGKHAKPEEERVPMCGIPYHASEAYIARLILAVEEDAEECVNDTWLHAWNAMPPQRPSILSAFSGNWPATCP